MPASLSRFGRRFLSFSCMLPKTCSLVGLVWFGRGQDLFRREAFILANSSSACCLRTTGLILGYLAGQPATGKSSHPLFTGNRRELNPAYNLATFRVWEIIGAACFSAASQNHRNCFGDTAWVLYKNSLYKNLRGSNPRRATYFQLY